MNKNQIIELYITDLNNLGCGVGRVDGQVVFVKGAVKGDLIRAKVIKVNKSFAVARLEEVLSPSDIRIESDSCHAPLSCGGCVYRHITYDAELELKTEYVRSAFRKAGLSELTVLPCIHAGREQGYRNKAQYPVCKIGGVFRAGFYASKSHNIVPSEDCAIQNPAFSPIVKFICDLGTREGWSVYDEKSGQGLLRHIYLRIGEKTGQIMVCLVINGDTLPQLDKFITSLTERFSNVASVVLSKNRKNTNVVLGRELVTVYGKPYIEDTLCGLTFKISPESFYQINRDGAELLYALARKQAFLTGNEVLMDLYCGTGTIGLSMARDAKRLCGIEIVEGAVSCARENARENRIENAEFFCADAGSPEVMLSAAGGVRPDVVIIDPPRKGSTKELIGALANIGVPRIVYVSCDADTLARDCAWFKECGYTVGEIQPVDMFPRTGHVECVVGLNKSVTHKMKLNSSPFEMIKNGKKTIELRLFDEKRKGIKVGDTIVFTDNASGEELAATVQKIHIFKNFDELYDSLPLLKCGYTESDIHTARAADMSLYYSAEEQARYGVVGIEISLL